MSVLESSLNAPAPAATPNPAPPAVENTGTTNTEVAGYTEVQGGKPTVSEPAKEPGSQQSGDAGKYKNLEDANKGYNELYKMWTEGAGKTKNAVEKLEKVLTDLPTHLGNQLGQIIAQNLASLQQKSAEPVKPSEPAHENGTNTLFQFSSDDLVDPNSLAQNLSRQFLALQAKQQTQAVDPAKLVEAAAPQFVELIDRAITQREQKVLKNRAESDIQELIDAGNDPALVKAAVVYGVENGKNSVQDSWRLFQSKYPVLFANKKAEDIIGEAAGQRSAVPRELGSGVNAVDANALRSQFQKVANYKFLSDEFI